jgi:tetratricopeptide (TPR) repeat protein
MTEPAQTTPPDHTGGARSGSRLARLAAHPATIGLLLCLLALLAYWPVMRCGFVNFDDSDYVTENLMVQAGLTLKSVAWAFSTGHAGNWHPLTWLSHMLDAQLYDLRPAGHHLTSLLFHLANTALLFLLCNRMTGALWRSALVAALFALHPAHVESVAWVSERKDVLSAFFFMLTLWAYAGYAKAESGIQHAATPNTQHATRNTPRAFIFHPPSSILYLLSLVFFTLGLMSKPMLVTLPFVLLLLDYWPLQRFQLSTLKSQPSTLWPLLREKLPFFLLSALSSVITFFAQHAAGATVSTAELSLPGRLANVVVSYVRYLGELVWPVNLAVFYPRPEQWPAWQVAGCALILVLLTLVAVWLLSRARYVTVGWFWFVGTLVPVIGLVQVGEQAIADRYTYLPYIGLSILIAWGAEAMARRISLPKALVGCVAVLALGALLALTRAQTLYWLTTETLFRHTVAVTVDNPMAQETLANALSQRGNLEEAAEHCLEALRVRPDFSEAQITYASILAQQGRLAEARARLAEVLQKKPREAGAHFSLAQAFNLSGDTTQAIVQYREGLKLKSGDSNALNNLAWIRAAHADSAFRNGTEAVQLAQQACELTRYQRPIIVGTLAAAYAEAGRFEEAVATAQKARALALAAGQKDLAEKNQQLLELYRARRPYHEPTEPARAPLKDHLPSSQ